MRKRNIAIFSIFIISGLALFFVDLLVGSVKIPFHNLIETLIKSDKNSEWYLTVFEFRLPKATVAALAGAALATSGLLMQTIFANPLAGPYILGISSGASLGVAFLLIGFPGLAGLGFGLATNQWAVVFAAWIGAAAVLMLILIISVRIRDIMTILIFGIIFGSAASAIVSIMQYFGGDSSVKAFIIWTLGSLGGITNNQLPIFITGVLLGLFLSVFLSKSLNVILLGEEYAKTMGVNIVLIRTMVFLSTSLLAGTVTAFCGPIGFIGIAVPHVARIVFKTANHFILLPGSIILGVNALLVSDIISQMPGKSTILPINSITALLGIPIVVLIIIRKQKISSLM